MKLIGRMPVIQKLMVAGISMGWLLLPSSLSFRAQSYTCAKPANAKCGPKTITVYANGVQAADEPTFVCRDDTLEWVMDATVSNINIHFDESPFESNFGKKDYCAGPKCAGTPHSTGKRPAQTKDQTPGYLYCHEYKVSVTRTDGTAVTVDPHIIVGGTGSGKVTTN